MKMRDIIAGAAVMLMITLVAASTGYACGFPGCGTIGDFVWHDLNCDGIQDAGEPGVPGVIVYVWTCGCDGIPYNADDEFERAAVTDANGLYLVTGLFPTCYYVEFLLPAGYEFSPQDQGSDDAVDSDPDPVTGLTAATFIEPDEVDLTWDAGLCIEDGGDACPETPGFWKNHPGAWPVDSLTLGNETYTKAELLAILWASTRGDVSLILARHLIAAKLSIENGSDPAPVSETIDSADAVLGGFVGKLPYGVKGNTAIGMAMIEDAFVLNAYNNDLLTPNCVSAW